MPHITFIHGIANKPPDKTLLRIWRDALARDGGIDLGASGVTSSMVYWADVMYEAPLPDEPAYESAELSESTDLAIKASDPKVDLSWKQQLPPDEKVWVNELEAKLKIQAAVDDAITPPIDAIGPEFERIPLPGFLKRELMKTFLRDVHHYLFNTTFSPRPGTTYQVQDEIRKRMVAALEEGASKDGPHIVVSHSMGTVISYDCLRRVGNCPRVDALMTIGSPLGLDEVQDGLRPEYNSEDGFPSARVNGRWVNVYDHLDPVAGFDPSIANDYQRGGNKVIEDINEQNWGRWRHDINKYLHGTQLRTALKQLLQI